MAKTPPQHPRARKKTSTQPPAEPVPPPVSPSPASPWLTRSAIGGLSDLPLDGPGRVLMTRPQTLSVAAGGERPLSVGAALGAALAGRTDNFTMVVGYFGHGGQGDYSTAHDLHDPVALLLAELADASDGSASAQTRFRLLFGGVASRASGLALELWWWLSRWHAGDPKAAEAWRVRVLACLPTDSARGKIIGLVHRLFTDGSELQIPLLDPKHADTQALRQTGNSAELEALTNLQTKVSATSLGTAEPTRLAIQTGSLLLYMLQRGAEVRFGAKQSGDQSLRIFHPKLYVVERGSEDAGDAFVFAGSANWSAVALDPNGAANIEVATVHRVSGAPYSSARLGHATPSLGADLAATARALFDAAPVFARWIDPGDGQPQHCDIKAVRELLTVPPHIRQAADPEHPPLPSHAQDSDAAPQWEQADHRRFAHAICRDIEIALGLNAPTLDATIHTLHGLKHGWQGKVPSTYQLDGAARLLALLQHSRGAMLTDEPGLGKTLAAQLVAAALIRERLVVRRQLALARGVPIASLPPIRVSILAPARVLGRGGRRVQAATQWFRHASEIRSAVHAALAAEPDLQALAERPDYLEIELFSNQSLSRKLLDKGSTDLRNQVAADLHHLACSEIVVIDEAHNFRNGGGRATRLLRFCLSLPVWGEVDWRVRASTSALLDDDDADTELDTPPSATGRKVLLLSATPFNNRIQDVSTQLGHFGKAQQWTERPGDLQDALHRRVDQLVNDSIYWTAVRPTKKQPTASADFARLLEAVAVKHIPGGRALDGDDIKVQSREMKDRSDRAKVRDGGPLYLWARPHRELGRIFAAIGQTLAAEHAGQPMPHGIQLDTRARIDAMLLGYVVQRSRRQVLEFVDRNEGPKVCASMFRAPKQPRAPLAIQSNGAGETDYDTQEREILEELFSRVLGGAEGDDGHTGNLSMLAYELRYLRGFDRGSGTGARTLGAANFIAFQTVNLVKRLQSCSYAFLMTLVRGLLRTNLYELALVEALVNPELREHGKTQQALPFPEDRNLILGHARRGCERVAEVLRDRLEQGSRRNQLRRLLGHGKTNKTNKTNKGAHTGGFFAELIGLNSGVDPRLADRFDEDLDLARDYLVAGLRDVGKGSRKARKKVEADGPVIHWVDRLLEDLAQAPDKGQPSSQIATDAVLCLDWVFGDSGEGLLEIVYDGLDGWVGEPMSELVSAVASSDKAIAWLETRLRFDRRATDLLAWLLGQTAVRLAAANDPAAREYAPGGDRSLIFSEYADTIDYLRVLLGALHRSCVRFQGLAPGERPLSVRRKQQVKDFLDDLCKRIPAVCESLAGDARATLESLGKTDLQLLPPPLDPARVAALLPSADALAQIAIELVEHAGIVTSRVAIGERIIKSAAESDETEDSHPPDLLAADASYDDDEALDPEAGSGSSIADGPALDSFSPWYQVDATSADITGEPSSAVAERLAAAQRSPVYTLLSTEVLAEGVNLQECGVAVHYDLPWNPTRLIQRNGRVDRRIDERVEQTDKREELAQQLIDAAASAGKTVAIDAKVFWAPRNIYHLTVPPIEPKLDDARRTMFAKRVRAVLFDKLSGIRRLFGLSAWPVVLGAEDARSALDGSLTYETAAFHRREELFLRWRSLRALGEGLAGGPLAAMPSHGAFVCALGPERLAQLHADLADTREGLQTDGLQGFALSFWSKAQPRSIPLRSGIDVAPFYASDHDSPRAFAARWGASVEHTGGVLALALTGPALLAWRTASESLPSTGHHRTVLEACAIPRHQAANLGTLPPVNWAALSAGSTEAEPMGPSSPTAMAEVVLDHLAKALLAGDASLRLRQLPALQPVPLDWAEVAQHPLLGPLLRRPLNNFPRTLGSPAPSDLEPEGFNIVVTS